MTYLLSSVEKITDKQSFFAFVELLQKDRKEHANEWNYDSIEDFLEAGAAWVKDNKNISEDNVWRLMGYE